MVRNSITWSLPSATCCVCRHRTRMPARPLGRPAPLPAPARPLPGTAHKAFVVPVPTTVTTHTPPHTQVRHMARRLRLNHKSPTLAAALFVVFTTFHMYFHFLALCRLGARSLFLSARSPLVRNKPKYNLVAHYKIQSKTSNDDEDSRTSANTSKRQVGLQSS